MRARDKGNSGHNVVRVIVRPTKPGEEISAFPTRDHRSLRNTLMADVSEVTPNKPVSGSQRQRDDVRTKVYTMFA